jgi:hypothetical protein
MTKLPVTYVPAQDEGPVSILNEADPLSLINMVPKSIKNAMNAAALKRPDLFSLGEEDFLKKCKVEEVSFNTTDHTLRDQFWIEYHHARSEGSRQMPLHRITYGAISKEGFYDHYLINAYKVAWLCTMPVHYSQVLKRNLTQLARNVADIIDMPIIDPVTKKLDKQLAQMQITLMKFHEVTLHGTPTQRIEQKTMAINVTRHEGYMAQGAALEGKEETLIERIKQLEARERAASHVPKLADWQTMPVTNKKMSEDD